MSHAVFTLTDEIITEEVDIIIVLNNMERSAT